MVTSEVAEVSATSTEFPKLEVAGEAAGAAALIVKVAVLLVVEVAVLFKVLVTTQV